MAAHFARRILRTALPNFWPKLLPVKQVPATTTNYKQRVPELITNGHFGFNRRLLIPLARALFFGGPRPTSPLPKTDLSDGRQICPGEPRRHFSDISSGGQSGPPQKRNNKRPLKLMDFPEIIWPHPLKSLRNLFFSFLIRGYFDQHYSPESFLRGAEQAVSFVSSCISRGEFDQLDGLVTRDAVREIQAHYKDLSLKQKRFVAVNPKDVFFRFVYEIGMIFDDEKDQRFVEVTAVFQGIHGLGETKDRNPATFTENYESAQDQVYVCNYRFIREYSKGREDDWTINRLNHFSPKEVVQNSSIFRR